VTIVLDTTVLIDHLRGNDEARAAFRVVAHERLVASVLTRVELLAGMRGSEEPAVLELFDNIEWIAVDEDLAERAGMLANRYLRSHPGIDPVDYVIAATTEQLDATLWTRNLKHFPMFEGLAAPY